MNADADVRLITLDPAHFHAALVQKEMLPGVDRRVAVYAPLGADLIEHLKRLERFNTRAESPTCWEFDIHCTPRSLERLSAERPGNAVVIAGRNLHKIEKIQACLDAGLHVLADKPWIVSRKQMPALEAALATATRNKLAAYDLMTERYEITTILQRELVNDPAIFGAPVAGSAAEPAVSIESIHHILKTVAGAPVLRPSFFFDVSAEGEGLADVGTHLVDMVGWTLFPGQTIGCGEIATGAIRRWPTVLELAAFRIVTGLTEYPAELAPYLRGNRLEHYCNSEIHYQVRGHHIQLRALWNFNSPAGVDLHHAVYRGTRADIEVRQGEKEQYRPEVFVTPKEGDLTAPLHDAVRRWQATYPGVECEAEGREFRIVIPDRYRVGHEAHFAQVLSQFLAYLKAPASMPTWESANMLSKYQVTTAAPGRTSPD